jgi:hypothetical protein
MADRLYLSLWLENHSPLGMHRHFSTAIRKFPFSTQSSEVYLRVSAVDPAEPALLEQVFKLPEQLEDIFDAIEKWRSSDIAFELEGFWDLWQELPEGWQLKPSRVQLFFFGPDFPSEFGESIRAELGIELLFLPAALDTTKDIHFYQSNLKSLLRLNGDWSTSLRLKQRKLWSDSSEDLSQRLQWMSQYSSTLKH